ncbi:MAG: rod shape-determining protein MreD [Cyanobacteria bacterium P01_A01_bin.84]
MKLKPLFRKKSQRRKKSKSSQSQFSQPNSRRRKKAPKFKPLSSWKPHHRQLVDSLIIFSSVLLCLLLLPSRLPGTELLGIGPNWLLIWVVTWSVKRTAWQGAFAGVILGLLQDGMTSPNPSHAISLGIVGFITGLLQKQRFIQEDFISIALIVFIMEILAETIFAAQLSWLSDGGLIFGGVSRNFNNIWNYYQKVVLASAILSSLWAPVVYYPLNRWWQKLRAAEQV